MDPMAIGVGFVVVNSLVVFCGWRWHDAKQKRLNNIAANLSERASLGGEAFRAALELSDSECGDWVRASNKQSSVDTGGRGMIDAAHAHSIIGGK